MLLPSFSFLAGIQSHSGALSPALLSPCILYFPVSAPVNPSFRVRPSIFPLLVDCHLHSPFRSNLTSSYARFSQHRHGLPNECYRPANISYCRRVFYVYGSFWSSGQRCLPSLSHFRHAKPHAVRHPLECFISTDDSFRFWERGVS